VLVESLTATRGTTTVIDADLLAKAGRFGNAGKVVPVVGGVLAIGSAGWDQWRADASNPNLSTTDRVGRSAGVGVYVGGASIAGAAIGTAIFPGVGTVAGLAIGAGAGLVAGAVASSITPVREAMADAGQWTANAAVDAYNWSGDRVEDIGEGISDASDWVSDKMPDIDMPDLNPF
jgi:phage-related tail protein